MTELLTKTEAATRARISVSNMEKRIASRTGPTITRIGRRVLIRAEDLEAWVAALAADQRANA